MGDERVLRGQWGAAVSTQVCVCGAVSWCFVWLVLSFVAARVSHVITRELAGVQRTAGMWWFVQT